jgi:hypothetical protein
LKLDADAMSGVLPMLSMPCGTVWGGGGGV